MERAAKPGWGFTGAESAGIGAWILDLVRHGTADDDCFDLVFPPEVRRLSSFHWSPVALATRAAELAVAKPGDKVLDVGAGPGKFCLIGSLVTQGVFYGIEQRKDLVEVARSVADRYEIPRAYFAHGDMRDCDWTRFESIYLYNPFSENLDSSIRIDDSCELKRELYVAYIQAVQEKLSRMPSRTRAVTLNGFGGDLPPSYQLVQREGSDSLPLELWIRM